MHCTGSSNYPSHDLTFAVLCLLHTFNIIVSIVSIVTAEVGFSSILSIVTMFSESVLELQTIHRFSQSRRRPLLGPSPGWKCLLALLHLRYSEDTMALTCGNVGAFSVIVKTDGSFAALINLAWKFRNKLQWLTHEKENMKLILFHPNVVSF